MMTMNSIPIDILLEIFSRLPAKSIKKCLRVSKQWESILGHPDFNELFLTKSSTRPRLLFAIGGTVDGHWHFFSSPQPQNPYDDKSSLVVTADSHLKFPKKIPLPFFGYASGLFYLRCVRISKAIKDIQHVICNPSTGQYAFSPKLSTDRSQKSFLGFDPVDKVYKVLSIAYSNCDAGCRILTLGDGKTSWRKIQCLLPHCPCSSSERICIHGVLYYSGRTYEMGILNYSGYTDETPSVIVCFDVRSETFKFLDLKCNSDRWINFEGKLAGVSMGHVYADGQTDSHTLKLCLSVLEDVEKGQWSKCAYTLHDDKLVDCRYLSIVGVTAKAEIVLSMKYASTPFYVYYFNPETNTLQSVEIQGFRSMFNIRSNNRVYAFVDHVEDLMFNIMKTRYDSTSISQPEEKPKPTSKSTLSKPQVQQDHGTFENNRFDALSLLYDD